MLKNKIREGSEQLEYREDIITEEIIDDIVAFLTRNIGNQLTNSWIEAFQIRYETDEEFEQRRLSAINRNLRYIESLKGDIERYERELEEI